MLTMQTAVRLSTIVLPGHKIEFTSPELTEGASVEVIVADSLDELLRSYPSALEAEYDALIEKKLDRTLTSEEACRLQDIRNVFAELDRLNLGDDIRVKQLDKIEAEIAQLRTEIQALPDA
jgi:hypothetical protein